MCTGISKRFTASRKCSGTLDDDDWDKIAHASAILSKTNIYIEDSSAITVSEIKAMSQRIVVAKMLSENKVYSDIVNETGASTATISRVNRSLHYGCDGYSVVFDRLKKDE